MSVLADDFKRPENPVGWQIDKAATSKRIDALGAHKKNGVPLSYASRTASKSLHSVSVHADFPFVDISLTDGRKTKISEAIGVVSFL
jgi:hypothetical protein